MSWEEIDAERLGNGEIRTYYGVAVGEDYSFQPDAIFSEEADAHEWVKWQQGIWTEEEEKGISPGAEVFVTVDSKNQIAVIGLGDSQR